jgi:glycosyltransferase involved in cell wall biosynthesis
VADAASRDKADGRRKLLYLGRLHPLKGLDLLLEALARIQEMDDSASRRPVELLVCGPDEAGERGRLEALAEKLGVGDAITFRGPVPPRERWGLLAACDALVLPSRSENFGIVVAEALAVGRPAITTKAAPWEALARNRCGWWCETSAGGLCAALGEFLSASDADLADMGTRGRALAAARFQWGKTAADLSSAYAAAVARKEGV